MKVVTVVGARPQFIKAAPVNIALREAGHHEFLLHTGQHYDHGMSQVFFDELGIPEPSVNLGIGSGTHGHQTGSMLMAIEDVLLAEKPDWVLVFGDTNSTLAGALAAAKLHIPVAHVEAGLRSFNREMPEEHNRVLTDHCADMLFCPTQTAIHNLANEGLTRGVHWVGDTMYDAMLLFSELARQRSKILQGLDLIPKSFLLATLHRPYNTDIPENLLRVLGALLDVGELVIFPVHPRTRRRISELDRDLLHALEKSRVKLVAPVGYLDMLILEQNARLILTDSGGMQKEAFFFGVPCVTLRPETEWVETVESGWNIVVGTDRERILAAVQEQERPDNTPPAIFGDGHASKKVIDILSRG